MKPTFPSIGLTVDKKLKASEEYLKGQHNRLAGFDSVDDLVTDEEVLTKRELRAIEHHIVAVRSAIARALWSREIFVGRSLLDDHILHLAKAGMDDLATRVIEELGRAGAGWPGFVLYPLTRFGMKMPGLFNDGSTLRTIAVFRSAGFAVGAQTHDLEQAHKQVASMARALGIGQRLGPEDLDHSPARPAGSPATHSCWSAWSPTLVTCTRTSSSTP